MSEESYMSNIKGSFADLTTSSYVMPPEWYDQDCVQLTWPHSGTDWAPYLDEIVEVCVRMVETIALYEHVIVAAHNANEVKFLLASRIDGKLMKNVSVQQCDNNDTWARDHAFITLLPKDDNGGKPVMLDFKFNGWGCKFDYELDNDINRTLYERGLFTGLRVDCSDFVLEGGSVESDGCGTVFTTSMCLLAPNRNQPLTRDEIESRLKKQLHAQRIVWLDYGQLEGDDTDGHIDTIVRVAPNDTLLYVGCDDERDSQYPEFKALELQLQQLLTSDGKPYRLLRLPMADAIFDEGERLPATYANFLVINGAVIVPTYGSESKDAIAMELISEAFPHRRVVGIDARTVVRQHGSLHCLTMQYPKGSCKINDNQNVRK